MAKATLTQTTAPDAAEVAFPEQAPAVPEQSAPATEKPVEAGALPSDPCVGEVLNRTIFTGDNLHVLRGLNSDTVDLIYLDPPFNSNRDYAAPVGSKAAGAAFKDTWELSDIDLADHELLEHDHPALHAAILGAQQTAGDSTMSYLLMMAPRLLEMKRVLKDTGSIYLHCDPTESHYLKMVMDAIFGRGNFQAEITWKRTSAHNDSKTFGNITDSILFYSPEDINVDAVRLPLNETHLKRAYRLEDDRGTYGLWILTGPNSGKRNPMSETMRPWRGYDPTTKNRVWAVPTARMAGTYGEWIADNLIPGYDKIVGIHDRLEALDNAGLLVFSPDGEPKIKRYLEANRGQVPSNLWDDIPKVGRKERTGYPTQKPLALLERIIKASSNPGDVVLDPFCGCATAGIAAEKQGRRWVGIDLGAKAMEMTERRLRKDLGLMADLAIHRTDQPHRTDLGKLPPPSSHKSDLWGKQHGLCAGCGEFFQQSGTAVDHIVPKSKGGHDHISNLQVLCTGCNSSKGNRPMGYLVAKELNRRGITYGGKVTEIVEEFEAAQVKEAEAEAPDALKAALAEAGLDEDEATPLLVAAVKAMAAHKAKEVSDGS